MYLSAKEPEIQARSEVEARIATQIVDDALAAGYDVAVDYGDGPLEYTRDRAAILGQLLEADEERLWLRNPDGGLGWVFLVYGNSGWDVICDHTVNLSHLLNGACALALSLEEWEGSPAVYAQLVADYAARRDALADPRLEDR